MGWSVDAVPESARVVVVIDGHLTAEEGASSARAFRDAIQADSIDVTWDLRRMNDYESAAREAWQDVIWLNRGNIRSLTVIGPKPVVRVGVMMLAALIGARWKILDAPDQA